MQVLFEKFEIIEILKKDEHSTVFLANHKYLSKKIILKTLDTQKISNPAILNRFKREAKFLAKLDHPNIIKVLDFGMFQNQFYLSFEYFESKNLRELLNSSELSDDEKTSLFYQLLEALNTAHLQNIIHRDIKPENILINESLQLKLADFGLAIERDENLLTNKSSIVGTPAYMSPEQIKGEKLTPLSDIFSLGIVVYELFAGFNPFLGNDINKTINNILSFDENNIFDNFAVNNEQISDCIKKMLKKDTRKRQVSIEKLFSELGIEKNELSSPKSKNKKKLKKIIYSLSVLLLIAILIIVFDNKTVSKIKQESAKIPDTIYSDQASADYTEKTVQTKIPIVNDSEEKKKTNEIANPPKKENVLIENQKLEPAKIYFQILPWAEIIIDSTKIQERNGVVNLDPGKHTIELKNPGYPVYTTHVNLEPGDIQYFKANLDTLFGHFECKVFPWGEVFIDGKYIGQTPFLKPIMLNSGKHSLSIHNPEYETVNKSFYIVKKETLKYEINLAN